jgi:hypothetical protein
VLVQKQRQRYTRAGRVWQTGCSAQPACGQGNNASSSQNSDVKIALTQRRRGAEKKRFSSFVVPTRHDACSEGAKHQFATAKHRFVIAELNFAITKHCSTTEKHRFVIARLYFVTAKHRFAMVKQRFTISRRCFSPS